MDRFRSLSVFYGERKVGTLARTRDGLAAFEYDRGWLADGFSLNPLSLPLESGVFVPKSYDPFEGLFGVFSDSLPDGWGRLLTDRMLLRAGFDPARFDSLHRLAIVGDEGEGALRYKPADHLSVSPGERSLDQLAAESEALFETKSEEDLDTLFEMAGSSGGARPKVNYRIDGEEWIVKFPSSMDRPGIGEEEYAYSRCAIQCGISMPHTRLLPSERCSGYFAVRRFDREKGKCVHVATAGALLETSHRIPNLDYHTLMQLTMILTRDYAEIEKLYRLMCFNVFAHNRDDHSKNFSYIYTEDGWKLSPAYDLTYSNSIGGEHATTVDGNGKDPGMEELLAVADKIGFAMPKARRIAKEIQEIVQTDLQKYLTKGE